MPNNRQEHVYYTRNELNNFNYYIQIIKHLKESNIKSYIDIGANTGEFCNVLFEKIPTLVDAYLFEVEKENINFIKKNIKNKKVNIFDFGIGYFFKNPILIHDFNPGGFSVKDEPNNTIHSNVVLKTLEELNLPNVDFVKIDIEGGEYNIIENSKYLYNIKFIDIEFHNHNTNSIQKYVEDKFLNYDIVFTDDYMGRFFIKNKTL
jgi:FkbM family methyltransferase